ncbi:hypothetical protein HG537_0F00110 [Torulaspora globosa]|uniref:Potassium transporter n=1 Tax=Torulaspora globosa TaxID=48254 RepID=A0A7H9HV61_9SACH|nr:hypothetical protein HG537_0F00110 [Torulaspora sp. CBS 2947]
MFSGMDQVEESSLETQAGRKKQSTKRKILDVAFLGFTSLGAIYGDIGTSPLYVLNTVFPGDSVSSKDVLGGVSCIFWLFTLVVIIKYCLLVLSMGPNNGEGGQVAIYCKLSRVLKTGPTGVKLPGMKEYDDFQLLTRSETMDSAVSGNSSIPEGPSLLSNRKFKKVFSFATMCACFLGCSLVMADGLLTPTTSVLSAVDGIAVAVPSFSGKVMPVAVCILLALFFIQPFGSQFISMAFSPIITVWFVTLFVIGIINIVRHPDIFRALSPKYAIDFLKEQGDVNVLGSVMLSITGCEAMFADVGHFSPLSVQLTLGCFVYPCLMIAYLGQASYLLDHPEGISNVFFNSVPGPLSGGFYWYVFVLSTLATVIASQALILGCFSILNQMIQIECFPRLNVIHRSAKHVGQIFIPTVNFLLMIAVIFTCVGFKSSSRVTAAYGLGVSMDLFITSFLLSATMIINFKVHFAFALLYFLSFGALEMCLIIANMKKVPHGAWFTLMVTGTMFSFISLWRWGVSSKHSKERERRVRLKDILYRGRDLNLSFIPGNKESLEGNSHSNSLLVRRQEGVPFELSRYRGVTFMYTDPSLLLNSPNTVPEVFKELVTNFPSLPSLFIFVGIKIATVPHVNDDERILIQAMGDVNGLYRCIVRYGFMDKVKMNETLVETILRRIEDLDPEYVQDVIQGGEWNPLNIFGRVHLSGERKHYKVNFKNDIFSFTLFRFIGESVRALFIEKAFAPLYSIQSIPSSIVSYENPNYERILYVGNELKI